MLKKFEQIRELARKKGKKTIAVVAPECDTIIKAVERLTKEGIVNAVLIGDEGRIEEVASRHGVNLKSCRVINSTDLVQSGYIAVDEINAGRADILMKGNIATPDLMKSVLYRERGLRKGKLLSHIGVIECPRYNKLLIVTDGGVNIRPDVEKKAQIIKNAIDFAKRIGIDRPNIGILGPIERVSPKIQDTVDAQKLVEMSKQGCFGDVIVEGPIAMDVVLSKEAARKKKIYSSIAGDTDILIVPDVTTGNAILKTLIWLVGANVGGIVMGAKVPIVLASRSDTPKEKILSIILSIAVCE
ncbi:MAG: bifunctional enoyl-CoA hydratase/phosphate acetyltransferase [Candidatus Marinimicrobia bacterium]|nr:bifunctional enoyl-CoA hydratase/phosphate acetyltransferase [Candidatus Neomarinimicrobiota bacterium]